MFRKLNNLINSPFMKNIFIMATGTVGAQGIAILLSPFITRIYGPEAFGIMGTFNSMISIIIPIAALTYPFAIVLPKNDEDAKGLVRLSLKISLIISVISLCLLITFKEQIISIFNMSEISSYIYLIPVVIIFAATMQVAEQWLIRTKQFKINANVTFLNSLIINASKVILGLFKPLASVLIVLTVLRDGIRAFLLVFFTRKSKILKTRFQNKNNTLIIKSDYELAKQYYDFPLYRAPENFISRLAQGLPVLMLTAFFGPVSAGFYTIGRTVLSMPTRLIGKAVGDVFYPRIAEEALKNPINVTRLIKKGTKFLGLVGIIPFGLVVIYGPSLFSFVFGSEWIVAGEYARWIALWAFSNLINIPAVRSLAVLNAQRFHLIYTVLGLIIRLSFLIIGFFVFVDDVIAIALFGFSGAILNVGLITITLKISKKITKVN